MEKRIVSPPSATRWSEDEMDVAETLRDLYRVGLMSRIPFSWISKRKRSSILNKTSPSPNKRLCTFNSLLLKIGASNPANPILFPTTDSDEKTKHAEKISLRKIQEKLLKIMDAMNHIHEMTKSQDALNQLSKEKMEEMMENLKKQYIRENVKLRKQEFRCSNWKIEEKVQSDDQVNGLMSSLKSTVENKEQKKEQNQAQQIQIQTVLNHQNQSNGPPSIGLGSNISNNNGPMPLSGLIQRIGEITANRVSASTQARMRRLQIIRVKKNRK